MAATGFTDIKLQETVGDHGATYRTRRHELTVLGLIRDTGRIHCEDGHRRRIIWAITSKGIQRNAAR